MTLEVGTFPVKDVVVGGLTGWADGVLEIDKRELLDPMMAVGLARPRRGAGAAHLARRGDRAGRHGRPRGARLRPTSTGRLPPASRKDVNASREDASRQPPRDRCWSRSPQCQHKNPAFKPAADEKRKAKRGVLEAWRGP